MNEKNDLTGIVGIPVSLGEFRCGRYGRHKPPFIRDGKIVFLAGHGYGKGRDAHGQNVYLLDDVPDYPMVLIEVRMYGHRFGAGIWHYLIGLEQGQLWINHVPVNVESVDEAVEYLKPVEVKQAEEAGLIVRRQGNWFFIPVVHHGRGEVFPDEPLDDDLAAELLVRGNSSIWVAGRICHQNHEALFLRSWHKAVRNKAIRHGRFGRGKGLS